MDIIFSGPCSKVNFIESLTTAKTNIKSNLPPDKYDLPASLKFYNSSKDFVSKLSFIWAGKILTDNFIEQSL